MEARMPPLPAPLCRQFSLDEVLSATQNFDDALIIGEGGFGKVYKATINVENAETLNVAIKRLDPMSNQGAPEFLAEIEMLTRLRHCNLVSLIGYCNDNSEMILIYEFMPQGTLHDHLHKYRTGLNWVQRLKISIGAARGLHYLHTGTGTKHGVIHRDVKSTNILLDEDYAAKISDFGLAKIGPTNTSRAYVNTLVRGTFGYLDPEYFLTQRLTRKSDVFAFGVVLFELLCGRAALDYSLDEDKCSLAKWAHESIEEGKVHEIIDANIKSQIFPKCLKVFVRIADRCLSSESKKRPTMAEIVVDLELSLALQIKFDSNGKPATGILAFARRIKWPFSSHEVKSGVENGGYITAIATSSTNITNAQTKSDAISSSGKTQISSDHLAISSTGKTQILVHHLKEFTFDDLKNATRGFKQDMRLGEGKFGEVFEGWVDINTSKMSVVVDGLVRVAIRRFDHSKIQHQLKEKLLDMTLFSEFNHPNLVKVMGYCFEDEQRLFLIYEFMENGSLHSHLLKKDKEPLPWKIRVQIATGIAEALWFLLTTQKHADNFKIKLHQILLDKNFNAKISDAESAKLVYGDLNKEMISDPVFYYPFTETKKFLRCISELYNINPKFDYSGFGGSIYAFGVVLAQILTGELFPRKLRQSMSNGKNRKESLRRALDPRLPDVDDITIKEAMKFASIALRCLEDPGNYFSLTDALEVLRRLHVSHQENHIPHSDV